MRILRLIFLMLLLPVVCLPARAVSNSADAPHVRVQLVVSEENLIPGTKDENNAGLYFKLEAGWHIYWMNPGDAGEPPHVQWTLPVGITAGPLRFPAPKRLPLGPLMDYGYEGEVYFPVMLNVAKSLKPGPVTLHAKVNWLVCREVCIPGKAELEVKRRVATEEGISEENADYGLFLRQLKANSYPQQLPANAKAVFQPTHTGLRLTIETGQRELSAAFFPSDPDILDNPAPQKLTPTTNGLILDLKKDASLKANPKQLKGVLELSGGRAYEIVALPPGVTAASASAGETSQVQTSGAKAPSDLRQSTYGLKPVPFNGAGTSSGGSGVAAFWVELLRISGLSFLGGLLLNLMPCVFPVLFLKGLALVNSGNEERAKLRTHGLVYAAGILVSFWALVGLLLGLRAAGSTLGWGFQFQSPVFLSLMAGLLFFLGLSLAGQFEIGLTLTSAGGSLAQKQGYTGSFFTGVLAVVVATPCTAPFMGAAVGYALAQSALVTFVIFTALALGLAAPYLALTLQPAWTRWLPKPGVWMEVLRQAVAVPIFATVIWLVWVLAGAYGASALAALLGSFLLLAIAGWFLGRWPARRWSTAVAAVILLGVIALAFIGQRSTNDKAGLGAVAEMVKMAKLRGLTLDGSHGPPNRSPAIRPRGARSLWTSRQAGA
jgi:thiol:disulfide interchange protein DsbD